MKQIKRLAVALMIVSSLGIIAVIAINGSTATSATQPVPIASVKDRPEPGLQGTFTYTIETYINPRPSTAPPFAGGENRVVTTRWVTVNSDGVAERYLSLTTTPDGTPWQEESFDGETRRLTFYDRQGDGATCTEVGPYTPTGSTLPLMNAEDLARIGLSPAEGDLPAELADFVAAFPGDVSVYSRAVPSENSPISDQIGYLVWLPSGQSLGDWNYGTFEGERVLIDSSALTQIEPAGTMPEASPDLPACGSPASHPEHASGGSSPVTGDASPACARRAA